MSTYRWGKSNYPNPCLVPGCDRPRYAYGLCKSHRTRLDRYGDTFEDVPLGQLIGQRAPMHRAPVRAMDGPFFCVCPTTRPDRLGVCVECGYRSVARMDHRHAETAYVRYPRLRTQAVEPAS